MIGQVKVLGTWVWKRFSDDALALGKAWVRRGKPKHAPADPPSMSTSQIKKIIATAKKPKTGASTLPRAKKQTRTEAAVDEAEAATRPRADTSKMSRKDLERHIEQIDMSVSAEKGEYLRGLEKRLSDAEKVTKRKSGGKVSAKKYAYGGRVAKYKK